MESNAVKSNHQGSKLSESTIEVDTLIEKSKCSSEYYDLENCLVDNERNFKVCQEFVRKFKTCWKTEK